MIRGLLFRCVVIVAPLTYILMMIVSMITCRMHSECERWYTGYIVFATYIILPGVFSILLFIDSRIYRIQETVAFNILYLTASFNIILLVISIYLLYLEREEGVGCIPRWVYVIDQISFFHILITIIMIPILIYYESYIKNEIKIFDQWIDKRNSRKRLMILYDNDIQRDDNDVHNYMRVERIDKKMLDELSFSYSEKEIIKKNTILKRSSIDSIIDEVYCCMCGEMICDGEEYYRLPYCGHTYDDGCMYDLLNHNNVGCVVCGTSVRMMIIKKIHALSDDIRIV